MLTHKTIRLHQLQQVKKLSNSFRERKTRVLDLDINYIETLGSSENAHPIFFLPGGLGSVEMDFKPVLPELNKQKYKWIAWDPPGYGKSRPPTRPYRPKDLKKFGINAIATSRRAQLVEMYGEEFLQKMWDAVTDEVIEMSKSEKYKENGKYQDILESLQCPTLIIQGRMDPLIGVPYGHHLNSMIKNSRLHTVENGTHNLHLRETKEFVKCIEIFVDTVVLKSNPVSKL